MIKGFNRRVVVMKDTGSDMFDEAYFIVKENFFGKSKRGMSAKEEARDIIKTLADEEKGNKKRPFFTHPALTFSMGAALGFFIEKFFF